MYIHEAIAATTNEEPFITRRAWKYLTSTPCKAVIRLQVTDTPDCCILESVSTKRQHRGWQPMKEDLVADDWEPIGI